MPWKHEGEIRSVAGLAESIRQLGGEIRSQELVKGLADGIEQSAGGEHRVVLDQRTYQAVKLTKSGFVGANGKDAGAYLLRWALHNKVFNDSVAIEGVVKIGNDEDYRLVISQEFIDGQASSSSEMSDYLNSKGFTEIEGDWIHPILEVKVSDTHTAGNFQIAKSGEVFAIDEIIAPASRNEVQAAAQKKRSGQGHSVFNRQLRNDRGPDRKPRVPPADAGGEGEISIRR